MFSPKMLVIAGAALAVVLAVGLIVVTLLARRRRRRVRLDRFKHRWQEVQHACGKQETWPTAILDADKLVDDALKATGFKGRTMGERLVSAQRTFTDNDSVWFGHKLSNKIASEEMKKPNKKDVQMALRGLRQALIDLGVLS